MGAKNIIVGPAVKVSVMRKAPALIEEHRGFLLYRVGDKVAAPQVRRFGPIDADHPFTFCDAVAAYDAISQRLDDRRSYSSPGDRVRTSASPWPSIHVSTDRSPKFPRQDISHTRWRDGTHDRDVSIYETHISIDKKTLVVVRFDDGTESSFYRNEVFQFGVPPTTTWDDLQDGAFPHWVHCGINDLVHWRRCDGAETHYIESAETMSWLANSRLWTAWDNEGQYLGTTRRRSLFTYHRRWNSARGAMRALDSEHPVQQCNCTADDFPLPSSLWNP